MSSFLLPPIPLLSFLSEPLFLSIIEKGATPHWKKIYADWQKFPGTQAQEKEKSRAVRLKNQKRAAGRQKRRRYLQKNRKKLPELEKRQKKISTKITTELQKKDETAGKTADTGKNFPV
ncbi:MAG: hypothetical protein ACOX8G_08070 [Eubacterium sp.]